VTQDIDLEDDDDDEDDDSIPFSFDDVGFSVSPDFRLVEMFKLKKGSSDFIPNIK